MNEKGFSVGRDFTLMAALDPPKGTNLGLFCGNADLLKGRVDAVLVNDSSDGIMRMSALAACSALLGRGMNSILGLNSRDRNRIALQADLLGAWAMGVREVVCENGKDLSYGDHPLTKPVHDLELPAMADMIARLNKGEDLGGSGLDGGTGFKINASIQWLDDERQNDEALTRMLRLVESGAQAIIVSPQFDIDVVRRLAERAAPLGVPILVSVVILKSVGMARYLNDVPGMSKVPEAVIQRMIKAPERQRAGIDFAAEFLGQLSGLAKGAVIVPLGWERRVPMVLEAVGR